jgi:hypothetical protein
VLLLELKMDNTACSEFSVSTKNEESGVVTHMIDLRSAHRTLGQVLLYTFGHVLSDRASLGLALPESLPFLVKAGKKKSTT